LIAELRAANMPGLEVAGLGVGVNATKLALIKIISWSRMLTARVAARSVGVIIVCVSAGPNMGLQTQFR
jgi:hypothetical protein